MLSLNEAAERHGLDTNTLRRWHGAGLISAATVGKPGRPWAFDPHVLAAELARLPQCVEDGCQQPVRQPRLRCREHTLLAAKARPPKPKAEQDRQTAFERQQVEDRRIALHKAIRESLDQRVARQVAEFRSLTVR